MRIGVLGEMPEAYAAEIEQAAPVRIVSTREDFEALVVWELDVPALVELVRAHPGLRWLHLRWAGVPAALLEVLPAETVLTNGSGAHGSAIGEYVAGVVLAHYKGFFAMRAAQERGEWLAGFRLRELRGQTVGIIGLGDLGVSIARVLRPFGVSLRGLRRSSAPCTDVDALYTLERLEAFLSGLDVLVVAAPLTEETRGLLGAAELSHVAPGALLVNVGRAAIVDQDAMLGALASGQLGGVALDVFLEEPLPADSPLWRTPNVFMSPHCADASPQSRERGFAILLANVRRFVAGDALQNLVDRSAGY